jgi:hypothetical protein
VVDIVFLRRRPPAVRAQALPLAAHHPSRYLVPGPLHALSVVRRY